MISTHENAGGSISLSNIEALSKTFSACHQELRSDVVALENEIAAVRKKYLPGLRKAVDKAANAKLELSAAVKEAPGLFVRPRTVVFHGIKVGYAKGKGKLEIADEIATLKRLETMFPDEGQRGMYLHVEVSLNKETLEELPAADLKKLGISVIGAEDKIVIKSTDSDIEKFVDALLKDAVEVQTEGQ